MGEALARDRGGAPKGSERIPDLSIDLQHNAPARKCECEAGDRPRSGLPVEPMEAPGAVCQWKGPARRTGRCLECASEQDPLLAMVIQSGIVREESARRYLEARFVNRHHRPFFRAGNVS